jgi:hypothetical protein
VADLRKPNRKMSVGIGTGEAHISLTINSRDNVLGVELYIPNNKELFERLFARKNEIEHDLGDKTLLWMGLPQKKACRIRLLREGEVGLKDSWNSYFDWLLREAEMFYAVFPKYMKEAVG